MGHVDCGFSGGFALLVVLFILLIIVHTSMINLYL
ncbi:YjcZ family sporulation protein [Bacillus anthracis]|nr:YjcZ family sporulation protein [Bacillus anthracis]OPD60713.1 sporulation protein YjcZ [Bacillus anthracis]HDR5578396.1 YjcZ family sporulation protein [Bacillus anthracis]